jgi:hypothetical protein
MNNEKNKAADILISLGELINTKADGFKAGSVISADLQEVMTKAEQQNPWFTSPNILFALKNWVNALQSDSVCKWINSYPQLPRAGKNLNIGVINASNIPFAGMHDLLTVLVSGDNYIGRNSSEDSFLLPYISTLLVKIDPIIERRITFTSKLSGMDAVIATGSNNSSRYFEYYFGKYPHIIRKNRNGVAVLTGSESNEQLSSLGTDIFSYFGLGCRNISKLYVPENYVFDRLFENLFSFNYLMNHNKYMNNFEYNNSVLLLKRVPFLQNGFLIIMEDERIASPISILHFEKYKSIKELEKNLSEKTDQLQCIVADKEILKSESLQSLRVDFGKTQMPQLWDYADQVDTMQFLINLSKRI